MSDLGPIGMAAVEYAAAGLAVIALHGVLDDGACTCRAGSDCKGAGKHPRSSEWQKHASTNTEEVEGWWRHYGERANVGIVAGPSGLEIVDIDGPEGIDAFGRLTGGEFQTQALVKTGRGWHLYFKAGGDALRPLAGVQHMKGLDLRAGNSFVVAPPSRHKNGGHYQWH